MAQLALISELRDQLADLVVGQLVSSQVERVLEVALVHECLAVRADLHRAR